MERGEYFVTCGTPKKSWLGRAVVWGLVRVMDDADIRQYERARTRRAKRLVTDYLSHLDSLAKKGPDEAELVGLQQRADLLQYRSTQQSWRPPPPPLP